MKLGISKSFRRSGLTLALLAAGALSLPASHAAPAPNIIELTQTPCQFLESENGVDQGFRSARITDCEAINARTAADRLANAKTLELAAGRHVFRVTNRSVPYELGFWLRGDGLVNRARLPSVSGGGLLPGKTQDYEITLTPGQYVYSCPLNNTPDYRLVVK